MTRMTTFAVAVFALLPTIALSHGMKTHPKSPAAAISTDQHAFGAEGNPNLATRTISISMDDRMQYSQSEIRVKQGETLTFAITNDGKLLHELVIGTNDELQKHAAAMRKNPTMEHEAPYMAHVKPGTMEKLTWQFTKPGNFIYGCLVAGHLEAGMKGTILVVAGN